MKFSISTLLIATIIVFTGCSQKSIIKTQNSLPAVYEDVNSTHEKKNDVTISLFRLNNYTDTPRAGMRVSNILQGMLITRGYKINSHIKGKKLSIKKARKIAKEDGSKYFIYGGVSEWRYKTGIDGEPAVSFQVSLYKTKNAKLVWSATGADSDWGNSSVGTTAQELLEDMMVD